MRLLKWTVLVLLTNSVLSLAQSPPAPLPQTLGQPSQSIHPEAVSELSDLAAKRPGLKGLSFELGTAFYQKGDYIKAIDSLKKALVEDPENKEAIQLLGLSYYLSGRPGEAITQLERVQTWY